MPEAGELCAVEALDREGLLVTSEGAFVRYLRVTAKNPLVMSEADREQVGHAFGQLVGRLGAGQSLQFYVEATPVRLQGGAWSTARRRQSGRGGRFAATPAGGLRRSRGFTPRCASRWSDTPRPRPPSTSPTT